MGSVTCHIAMSLDGFVAGPNQSIENPIGEGWDAPASVGVRHSTTFTFVTDGIEPALKHARTAAGEKDIAIAGGAKAVQQYLAAGILDEIYLHLVPIILAAGERLFADVGDPGLEPVKVIASPAVTHVKYRVVH